ncbi:GtrA family protein [Neobacillus massiliamazoniensis]|jgi:putative flippase GtrA|uniref:Teichoic acid glycosylation protein n=1 Tax=Neobacillus massiliamazoniensis TaxID=1499688 RepID=A0A0U1NTL2_9BACI|nr:GtrA family protein [Neobacillus massiliamazoniensis]CRK81373.1 teichoic acid glycosylation protein [Neobacillus massiliamazoniensis]
MKINKEVLSYLVFGGLTTLTNIVSYSILAKVFHMDFKLATTVAWLISVIFAFITNKLYVFNSKQTKINLLIKEFSYFMFFRLLSYFVDLGMMILMVDGMKIEDIVSKIAANIVVVVLNYFASRYVIFKPTKEIKKQ